MDAADVAPRAEIKTIGLVSFAHLLSHLYMLALPPLFIYLRDDMGVSFVELGLTVTAYAITTGLLQTPMGFLVNRIGGGKVLVGGLFLNAAAIAAVAFCTQFWQVIALMFIAGVGSSVFHPADYSILSARVSPKRLGRALATHALGGNLGFVAAPPIVVGLAALWDWRTALLVVGSCGMALAALMAFQMSALGAGKGASKPQDSWRNLVRSPAILLLFVFYTLSAAANSGVVHFSVSAFSEIYGVPLATAAIALTTYQVLSMAAVLPGGWLADRFENHETGACDLHGGRGGVPPAVRQRRVAVRRGVRRHRDRRGLPRTGERIARHFGARRGERRQRGDRVRVRHHRLFRRADHRPRDLRLHSGPRAAASRLRRLGVLLAARDPHDVRPAQRRHGAHARGIGPAGDRL